MINFSKLANLFYHLISTPRKMIATGFMISAILSTIVFIFVNYNPYYYTKGIEYENEAKTLCSNIQVLADSHALNKDGIFPSLIAINKMICRTSSYVEVLVNNDIRFDNGKKARIDLSRTLIKYQYMFKNQIGTFRINTTKSNKPQWWDHLRSAWTWSIDELIKDKKGYFKTHLYLRSKFLYISLAIVSICTFSMLILLRGKYRETIFLKEQLEKEGYFLIQRRQNLVKQKLELEKTIDNGPLSDENEQRLSNINENIQELNVEIDKITIKSGINVGHAQISFFDAGEMYTTEKLKEKLLISNFLADHRITHIKYSDRYFRKTVHMNTFKDVIDGNWLSEQDTTICINVVLVDAGETKEKKQDRMEKLIKSILVVKNLDVNVSTINKHEFLHMRKLELIRDDDKKMDLIFDQGMDFVSPYQDKYIVNADNYVVIQTLQP